MPIQLANNASGTLATAISASDTGLALTTGDGAAFPALGLGDYFYATITSSGGTQEIVKATARSGDSLTIVRAQESTVAQSFAAGSRFELRVTAQSIIDTAQQYAADADLSLRVDLAAANGSSLVGFQQAGSSTVLRTAQAKLRETVSVKDFGAVGDGVVDDTAAIQATINSGRSIYIPAGTYVITTIFIPYDRTIIGAGKTATFVTSVSNQPIVSLGAPSSAKTQMSNFTIRGSNNPAFTNQHGLSFPATPGSGVYDCDFTGMEITQCGGNGIDIKLQPGFTDGGMFYNSFNDVKSHFNLGYGANFEGGLFNNDVFINCVFNFNRLGGVYYHNLASQTQAQKYINCFMELNGNGIVDAFGIWVDQTSSNLQLDSCFIEGNGIGDATNLSYGVRVKSPSFLSVTGTTIAAQRFPVYIDTFVSDGLVNIEGSIITNNQALVPFTECAVFINQGIRGLVNIQKSKSSFFGVQPFVLTSTGSSTPVIVDLNYPQIINSQGAESVKNGTFTTDTTDWGATNCTLSSVAGGFSGNCLEITATSGASQTAGQSNTLTIGQYYRASIYVKSGTSGDESFAFFDTLGMFSVNGVTSSTWTKHERIFKATSSSVPMRIGKNSATIGTMLFDNASITAVAQTITESNALVGSSGGLSKSVVEASVPIAAAASAVIPINVLNGEKILGVQLRVDSALTAGDLWDAAFSGGSTDVITTARAVAKNTKFNLLTSIITTGTTNITVTKNGGGSFTAGGSISAIVYIEKLVALASLP